MRSSNEEGLYRLSVFTQNYLIIEAHNANPENTYTMGINQFSDLTPEEFREIYLMKNDVETEMEA